MHASTFPPQSSPVVSTLDFWWEEGGKYNKKLAEGRERELHTERTHPGNEHKQGGAYALNKKRRRTTLTLG